MNLLISDFDHTMYNKNDESVIKLNTNAVNNYQNENNLFVIATSRAHLDIKNRLHNDGINYDYLISTNGTTIFDKNDRLVYFTPFKAEDLKKIFEILRKIKYISSIETKDFYGDTTPLVYYIVEVQVKIPFNNDTLMERFELSFELIRTLESLGYVCDIYTYDNEIKVYINPSITKKQGIIDLLETKNLNPTSIYTIGDGYKDYEMIRDFNGYAIEGSNLSQKHPELPTIETVHKLIKKIGNN